MNLVNVGDIYFTAEGRVFEVIDFWVDEGEPWVKYQNTDSGKEYSCLHDAFMSRFSVVQPSFSRDVQRTRW